MYVFSVLNYSFQQVLHVRHPCLQNSAPDRLSPFSRKKIVKHFPTET